MTQLYGIVDTARDPRLHDWVIASADHACLFAGELSPTMRPVLPYLVQVGNRSPIWEAWRTTGWGHHWGLVCAATATLAEVRRHFRRFLQVRMPDGDVVQFRFYDPRVWRDYLPGCTPEERNQWFGCVTEYRCATASGDGTLAYRLSAAGLAIDTLGPP